MKELFKLYDKYICAADSVATVQELEGMMNTDHAAGRLDDIEREALEGACVYMEQQLKAGKKPEEIKHRNGGKKDAV